MLFLRDHLDKLIDLDIVELATNPTYGSSAFVVPKKLPKKYRVFVDMRKLNKWTVPTALRMPNLEQQLSRLGPANLFGSLDVFSGFIYLPTSKESRNYFTLITADSAYYLCGAYGLVQHPSHIPTTHS